MEFQRITFDPDQMAGVPCLRGLRIPVASVLLMLANGMSRDEILAAYPDLELGDIQEALHFAAEAVTELRCFKKDSELNIFTTDGRINPDKAFALAQRKMLELTPEEFMEIDSRPFEMKGVNRAVVRKIQGSAGQEFREE